MPTSDPWPQTPGRKTARGEHALQDVPTQASDTHLKTVRSFFGTHAQQWSDLYTEVQRVNDLVLINRKNVAVNCLTERLPTSARILDAGCGAGLAALALAQHGFFVHGVDLAKEMIDLCEEHFAEQRIPQSRYTFTQADVLHHDFEAGSFDGVVALGVLQYQVAQEPMLATFHRLLKPGGIAVISGPIAYQIPNYFGLPVAAGKLLRKVGILKRPAFPSPTRYRFTVGRYKAALRSADFEMIDYIGHGFADWAVIGPWIGFTGELILHRLFTGVSTALPITRWANDLVVVARRIS